MNSKIMNLTWSKSVEASVSESSTPSWMQAIIQTISSAYYPISIPNRIDLVLSGDAFSACQEILRNNISANDIYVRSADRNLVKILNDIVSAKDSPIIGELVRSVQVSTNLGLTGQYKIFICHFEPSGKCHIFATIYFNYGIFSTSFDYGYL